MWGGGGGGGEARTKVKLSRFLELGVVVGVDKGMSPHVASLLLLARRM